MLSSLKSAFSSLARKVTERLRVMRGRVDPKQQTDDTPPPPAPLTGLARLRKKLHLTGFVKRLKKQIAEDRLRSLEHNGNRHERRRAQSILYRHRSRGRALVTPRLRAVRASQRDRSLKAQLARRRMIERKGERRVVNIEAKKIRRRQRLIAALRHTLTALEAFAASSRAAAAQMQAITKTMGRGRIFMKQGDSFVYLGETTGPVTIDERKAA
jgi:hypothetical protein